MAAQVNVKGLNTLNTNLKRLALLVPEEDMSVALEVGGNVIVDNTKKNIVKEDLIETRALLNSVRVIMESALRALIVVGTPYAAVHEFGLPEGGKGMWSATARQIRFFWAKWLETGNEMWKALALKGGYTIPPRPYFTPAIRSSLPQVVIEMSKSLASSMANRILKS